MPASTERNGVSSRLLLALGTLLARKMRAPKDGAVLLTTVVLLLVVAGALLTGENLFWSCEAARST